MELHDTIYYNRQYELLEELYPEVSDNDFCSLEFIRQRQFMQAAGQTVNCLNMQQLKLYIGLVIEETQELIDAYSSMETQIASGKPIHRAEIAELLDAAGDIIVVAGGVANSIGINPEEILARVWNTNMDKISADGKVQKREDGKILKPPGWEPPIFTDFADRILGNPG